MDRKIPHKLIVAIVGLILVIFGISISFDVQRVSGNEIGIRETWSGVDKTPLPPSVYIRNRWTTSIFPYDMSNKIFVMNDKRSAEETGVGRESDAYLVQSADQQDMHINLNVRWRLDPEKTLSIHTKYRAYRAREQETIIEERLIRPVVMRVVKNHATKMTAMKAYSGDGLVALQTDIEKELADPSGEIRQQGVIVDNFVIEKIALDPNYTAEIKARQIAQQKKLRADEETKAADAEALKVKSVAQADLNRAVVEAERDKQVAILKAQQEAAARVTQAEAQKEQTVLEAQASAERVTIAAKAEKEAAENRADAILAEGRAKAEAQKLSFSAYSVSGGETYAMIEISKNMGDAFKNFNGYIPPNMNITSISTDFLKAVQDFTGHRGPPVK